MSASLFKTLLRYTDFSSASYADTCSKPPHGSTVLKYISSASTGTQATVFKYPTTKEIILAFRGTSTPQDFDYDLFFTALPLNTTSTKCSSCKVCISHKHQTRIDAVTYSAFQVHSGFQAAWNSVSASAISGVKSAKQSNAGYTLTITGHSLGGGIAAIAAASFAAAGNTVTVYTYGEPRNGNTAWTTYLQSLVPTSRYFRVTHANDGVPQIPPKELGFQHHGTEYWESKSSNNTAASTYKCDHTEPKVNNNPALLHSQIYGYGADTCTGL